MNLLHRSLKYCTSFSSIWWWERCWILVDLHILLTQVIYWQIFILSSKSASYKKCKEHFLKDLSRSKSFPTLPMYKDTAGNAVTYEVTNQSVDLVGHIAQVGINVWHNDVVNHHRVDQIRTDLLLRARWEGSHHKIYLYGRQDGVEELLRQRADRDLTAWHHCWTKR